MAPRTMPVTWPTLDDFACGADPNDTMMITPMKDQLEGARPSPSNPQAPRNTWGPTHSSDEEHEEEEDGKYSSGNNNNANNVTVDNINSHIAPNEQGSGGSSSGNRTNPQDPGTSRHDLNDEGDGTYNNTKPSIERIWERAGHFGRKLTSTTADFTHNLSFVVADFGLDVCTAATGALSAPCIGAAGLNMSSASSRSNSANTGEGVAAAAACGGSNGNCGNNENNRCVATSTTSSESTRNRRNVNNENDQPRNNEGAADSPVDANNNSSGGIPSKRISILKTLGFTRLRYPGSNKSDSVDASGKVSRQKQPFLSSTRKTMSPSGLAENVGGGGLGVGKLKPIREHEEIEVLPNHKVQVRLPPLDHPTESNNKKRRKAPVDTLEVNADMAELERSISELTMRSSYAAGSESLNKIPDNRRMAYYAVGKHHRQSGRGGNRRCYFTGKLILGGAPFYAGSVQQGLRTLVVFCLPSALGLPHKDTLKKNPSATSAATNPFISGNSIVSSVMGSVTGGGGASSQHNSPNPSPLTLQLAALQQHHQPSRQHSRASASTRSYLYDSQHSRLGGASHGGYHARGGGSISTRRYMNGGASVASKSMSRLSSLDDLSLSIDGDLDPNWGLDRDFLLSVLPEANADLIAKMSKMYPEQFETLPIQVRDPMKWKLYVKFCFFSGLPIAEGEMHYKVRDDIADQVYGEEIVLSHEVMEAVNGESAEILTLPNQKAFRYLRKHYTQQCSKLDERVFRRNCWERVAPEV